MKREAMKGTRHEEALQGFKEYKKSAIFSKAPDPATWYNAVEWADQNPKSAWISIKDNVPSDDECVITVEITSNGKRCYHLDYYDSESGEWDSGCEMVSYWMPIPEPPKGGEK